MSKKLRIGIIGGGNVLDWHAPTFLRMADVCEVVAAAEVYPERHDRIRATLKNPDIRCYTSYEEMLEKEDLDLVDILLPHFLHMDACVKAAEHGVNVLTEKVMARNTYECQQMVEACKKNNVQLGVAHDRRYSRDWLTFKKLVDDGKLGKVHVWKLECNGGIGSYTKNEAVAVAGTTWFGANIDTYGGGAIMGNLVHQIDGMRFISGKEVDKVTCISVADPGTMGMQAESAGFLTGKLTDGSIFRLTVDWIMKTFSWNNDMENPLWYEMIEAAGDKGDAYFIHGKGTFFRDKNSLNYELVSNYDDLSGHDGLIEAYIRHLLGEETEFSSFGSDSLRTVEVAEAAYISENQGRTVQLPLPEYVPWEDRIYLK